jgi:putative YphP/YqiW family bacilliredoxin
MYPEAFVAPMREELTRLGVEELRDVSEVERALAAARTGTTLAIVNSVCGCAAAMARPAVAIARQADAQPDRYVTVFAGQDREATERFRQHLAGIPPSSPSIFLLKDGEPVFMLERRHIQGRSASAIAADLTAAFEHYCGEDAPAGDGALRQPEAPEAPRDDLPPTFRSIL